MDYKTLSLPLLLFSICLDDRSFKLCPPHVETKFRNFIPCSQSLVNSVIDPERIPIIYKHFIINKRKTLKVNLDSFTFTLKKKQENLVGQSNGSHHSVWEASENNYGL